MAPQTPAPNKFFKWFLPILFTVMLIRIVPEDIARTSIQSAPWDWAWEWVTNAAIVVITLFLWRQAIWPKGPPVSMAPKSN